jgi:hypothetical protein
MIKLDRVPILTQDISRPSFVKDLVVYVPSAFVRSPD